MQPQPVTPAWEWREIPRRPTRITQTPRGAPLRIANRENRHPPSDSTVLQTLATEEFRLKEQIMTLQIRKVKLLRKCEELRLMWLNHQARKAPKRGHATSPLPQALAPADASASWAEEAEEEEEGELDEASKAFLATSVAYSLSLLELRALCRRFGLSPSGFKLDLARRLEIAVHTNAVPLAAIRAAIAEYRGTESV